MNITTLLVPAALAAGLFSTSSQAHDIVVAASAPGLSIVFGSPPPPTYVYVEPAPPPPPTYVVYEPAPTRYVVHRPAPVVYERARYVERRVDDRCDHGSKQGRGNGRGHAKHHKRH